MRKALAMFVIILAVSFVAFSAGCIGQTETAQNVTDVSQYQPSIGADEFDIVAENEITIGELV